MQTHRLHYGVQENVDGIFGTACKIWSSEGPLAFYKGFGATILFLSHIGVQLPLYEDLKSRKLSGVSGGIGGMVDVVLAASLSKFVATVATYPIETVRTRLQD